jgi:hypothetical protein
MDAPPWPSVGSQTQPAASSGVKQIGTAVNTASRLLRERRPESRRYDRFGAADTGAGPVALPGHRRDRRAPGHRRRGRRRHCGDRTGPARRPVPVPMARECDRRSAAGMGAGTQRRVADVTVETARMPPASRVARRTSHGSAAICGCPLNRPVLGHSQPELLRPVAHTSGPGRDCRRLLTAPAEAVRFGQTRLGALIARGRRSCAADTTTGET